MDPRGRGEVVEEFELEPSPAIVSTTQYARGFIGGIASLVEFKSEARVFSTTIKNSSFHWN
jgi:hypothetical protein